MELPAINYINTADLTALNTWLDENEYFVVEIGDEDVVDAKSFFSNIKSILPLDPPLSGQVNWDAFSDSLWYGIDNLAMARVAILWKNAELMMKTDVDSFRIALECFTDAAQSLASEESGVDKTIVLSVFLIGYGREFVSMNTMLQA